MNKYNHGLFEEIEREVRAKRKTLSDFAKELGCSVDGLRKQLNRAGYRLKEPTLEQQANKVDKN